MRSKPSPWSLLCAAVLSSCTPGTSSAVTTAKPGRTARLLIDFENPGNGTDKEGEKALEALIEATERRRGHSLGAKEVSFVNKERSFTICLALGGMTADEQADFVARTRTVLDGRRVAIRENSKCPRDRAR